MSPTYLPHCFSTRLYYIAANFASDLGKDSTCWLPLPHRPFAALHVAHSAPCLLWHAGYTRSGQHSPFPPSRALSITSTKLQAQIEEGERINTFRAVFFYGSMPGGHIQSTLGDFGHGCTWRRRRMKVWVLSSPAYLLKLVNVLSFSELDIPKSAYKRTNNGWNHG